MALIEGDFLASSWIGVSAFLARSRLYLHGYRTKRPPFDSLPHDSFNDFVALYKLFASFERNNNNSDINDEVELLSKKV